MYSAAGKLFLETSLTSSDPSGEGLGLEFSTYPRPEVSAPLLPRRPSPPSLETPCTSQGSANQNRGGPPWPAPLRLWFSCSIT